MPRQRTACCWHLPFPWNARKLFGDLPKHGLGLERTQEVSSEAQVTRISL
jgi:hypothetical protein